MQYDLVTILSHVLLLIVHQLRIKLHLVSQEFTTLAIRAIRYYWLRYVV